MKKRFEKISKNVRKRKTEKDRIYTRYLIGRVRYRYLYNEGVYSRYLIGRVRYRYLYNEGVLQLLIFIKTFLFFGAIFTKLLKSNL